MEQAGDKKILTKYWGQIDPHSIESYCKFGGYRVLAGVLRTKQDDIIRLVKESGLRGRGGGGFSVGQKWEIASTVSAQKKYFICNLDESEPGTYKDRMLAENNPHLLLEGIIIGAYAVGAKEAIIYLNGNFSMARTLLNLAVKQATEKNFLGNNIMGSLFNLDIRIFFGAGSYICGEESALISSLEGKRPEPRFRPPYVAERGLWNKPTVVNNAETICNLVQIIKRGPEDYRKTGVKESYGTKLFCVDGAVKRPGLYEAPLGVNLRELIYDYAGGITPGSDFWFAQLGGASGAIVMPGKLDRMIGYDERHQLPPGTGSVLVVDKSKDIKTLILSWLRFFQRESCGKCVPCREGTFRLLKIAERMGTEVFGQDDERDFFNLVWTLDNTTFCPLGKFAVRAIKDLIKYKLLKFALKK